MFDTIGGNTLLRSPDTQALHERSYFSSSCAKGYCLSKKIMQQSQWNINEGVVSIAKG
ncbi:hypothetical protein ACFTRD_15120 [Paenibacillus sp. NPDC056933]|uniref:hypothetical protein n=1 Tax=Paenibacillus sp. NPDC056933 TaxID=3345968 RepID=UPI003642256E